MKKALIISTLAFAPLVAVADEVSTAYQTGFYLGAGLGVVDYDDDDLSRDLGYDVGYPGAIDTESDDTAFKFFAGYKINNIVSVEGSYTDYGDTDYKLFKQRFMTLEIKSVSVAANLGYSFDNGWRPFGIIGLSHVSVDYSSPFDSSLSGSEDYTGVHYGVGADYSPAFNRSIAFRMAIEGDAFVDDSFDDSYSPYYDDEYVLSVITFYAGVSYTF